MPRNPFASLTPEQRAVLFDALGSFIDLRTADSVAWNARLSADCELALDMRSALSTASDAAGRRALDVIPSWGIPRK
jgi:hypothetical protein